MKKIAQLCIPIFFIYIFCVNVSEAYPFYITFNAGISKLKQFCTNPANGFSCNDTSIEYGLDGGYQFNELFGIEIGYASLGNPKKTGPFFSSTLEVTEELSGYQFLGTATYPISNSFALIGKAGISRTNLNLISTTSPGGAITPYSVATTSLAYGFGLKYTVNSTYSLDLQYLNLGKIGDETIGTDNLSVLKIGLTYTFEKPKQRVVTSNPSSQPQALPTKPATKKPTPFRAIFFLERPPAEDKRKLEELIAGACHCQPTFVRLHNSNAVVYEIYLTPDQSFSTFKSDLLATNNVVGLKSILQSQ